MKHIVKRLRFYVSWPWLWLYFASAERARVIIWDDRGRALLVQGKWMLWYDDPGLSLPGGGLRRGEDPAAGAVRELAEELGLKIAPQELRPLGITRIHEHGIAYNAHLFAARLQAAPALHLQHSEIVDAQWYTPKELTKFPLKPEVQRALELSA